MDATLLAALNFIGVAVFAATGALAASRRQLDPIGFAFLAALTGVGGGTVRDVLLGRPVFWITEPDLVALSIGVAAIVFFTAHLVESRYRLLLWADAVGISGYCVLGAASALDADASPLAAILLGMTTATFGGILRDVLTGEPSVLMRKEIYVTATLVGAGIFVGLMLIDAPFWPAALAGAASCFLIRAGALTFGWTLPIYRSRPGRPV